MIKDQFQKKHSETLKAFYGTECGKALIEALVHLRPPLTPHNIPHLHSENTGAVRGYELCLKHMVNLCVFTPPMNDVEADYGVKDVPVDKQ